MVSCALLCWPTHWHSAVRARFRLAQTCATRRWHRISPRSNWVDRACPSAASTCWKRWCSVTGHRSSSNSAAVSAPSAWHSSCMTCTPGNRRPGPCIISLDQEQQYVDATRALLASYDLESFAEVIHAPMKQQKAQGRAVECYDFSTPQLQDALARTQPDFILVDGPAGGHKVRLGTLLLAQPYVRPGTTVLPRRCLSRLGDRCGQAVGRMRQYRGRWPLRRGQGPAAGAHQSVLMRVVVTANRHERSRRERQQNHESPHHADGGFCLSHFLQRSACYSLAGTPVMR